MSHERKDDSQLAWFQMDKIATLAHFITTGQKYQSQQTWFHVDKIQS